MQTSQLFDSDFFFQVSRGNVPGHSIIILNGHNSDLDSGASEDIWEAGGDLSYLTSAEQMNIASTSTADTAAGTGTRSLVITGLDKDYNCISENITMNGTTDVLTANSYLRVRLLFQGLTGSGEENAGIITATAASAATIQCQMGVGEGISKNSHYTVPRGCNAFIIMGHMSTTKTSGASPIVTFTFKIRRSGQGWITPFDRKIDTSVHFETHIAQRLALGLQELSDLRSTANTTANNTDVYSRFFVVQVHK